MSRNKSSKCTIILAILSTVLMTGNGVVLDCYNTTVSEYDGHQQTTATGIPCLRWVRFSYTNFPDASVSDAANFCRAPDGFHTPWCITTSFGSWNVCGINKCGDDGLSNCGQLSIDKPTILGRNVAFSFTPDTYDRNATLEWQRSTNGNDKWKTLPLNNKFNQFEKNMIYYLILINSLEYYDEVFYRVHYYNETIHCWMDAGKLTLTAIDNSCGLAYLRSEMVVGNGTVEIEYYPSAYVMQNIGIIERRWTHFFGQTGKVLTLADGSYEEKWEQNNKYVLTIFQFSVSMNGNYGVYCVPINKYTNFIAVNIPEPPSVPVIVGLQDIENCMNCIVAEENEMFKLECEIYGGTRPLTITMTIGNESYIPLERNSTTYIVFFTVRDHHHMENGIFSVMNDALSSPLNVTAQMFVIKPPTFQFSVPELLRDEEAVNITCMLGDGRPNPNVYFSISGSKVSSANSHFYNRATSLNTNIITLTTFKKEWNKENITCCRYNKWYKSLQNCSLQQQVNYLFPPSSVMLEVKAFGDSPSQMYAKCTVYGSNPACNAQISAPSGIKESKRSSRNISLPHGAWNSVSEVNLNVSEEDNGKDVTCVVECGEFSVDLTDTVKILLPHKVDEDDKYNNKQKTAGQASDKSIIWIILGACVLVVVIIVIAVLFIVFRKKGQTLEDKREGRVHHDTQEGHARCTIQKSEDRPAGNQNEHALDNEAKENRPEGNLKQSGNRLHDDNEVPIYSQPVKKKTTENPDNIYAQVNKTRKTATSPSSANSSKVEKDGQLLYADLAFDPNAAPSKAAVAKQEDSPTEYVDIDYVKTKANKEIDDDPTEQENL